MKTLYISQFSDLCDSYERSTERLNFGTIKSGDKLFLVSDRDWAIEEVEIESIMQSKQGFYVYTKDEQVFFIDAFPTNHYTHRVSLIEGINDKSINVHSVHVSFFSAVRTMKEMIIKHNDKVNKNIDELKKNFEQKLKEESSQIIDMMLFNSI